MLGTVLDSTFQSVDPTKPNQHKEVPYDPTEVTARALDHFLKDAVDAISNSPDAAAYYRAVAQQKHLSGRLALWEFCDAFDVRSLLPVLKSLTDSNPEITEEREGRLCTEQPSSLLGFFHRAHGPTWNSQERIQSLA